MSVSWCPQLRVSLALRYVDARVFGFWSRHRKNWQINPFFWSAKVNSSIVARTIGFGWSLVALVPVFADGVGVAGLLESVKPKVISSDTRYFSFCPSDSGIIVCGERGVIGTNPENGRETVLLKAPAAAEYLWAWRSADKKMLLVLNSKGKLVLAEIETGKTIQIKDELPKGFKRCEISPDGSYFLAIGGMEDSVLKYWQLKKDKLGVQFRGTSSLGNCNTLYDGAFSPDGKVFATVSGSGLVDAWSRPPVRAVRRGTLVARNGGLSGLAFSSDGKMLAAAAAWEPFITLLNPANGHVIKKIEIKKGDPLAGRKIAFLKDCNVLVTADGDHVGFLDIDSGQTIGNVSAGDTVRDLKVSPDGRWLAVGTSQKSILLWRIKEATTEQR